MIVGIGVILCLAVILWIVVPAWPPAPPKPPEKRQPVGYTKTGKLLYEKPKNKIDFYA